MEESVLNIINATKPRETLGVSRNMTGLSPAVWDLKSSACMYSCILHVCTVEATFLRYKSFFTEAPCSLIKELIADGKVCVMEVNENTLWGSYKGFIWQLVEELEAKAEANKNFDLKAAFKELCPGNNKLGEILTEFLLAIRTMEYADYRKEVNGVVFFEEISKRRCTDSRTASVEEEVEDVQTGRTLSC